MKHFINFVFILLSIFAFKGCYSFQGTSIPPEAKTYYVETFDVRAPNAEPTLGQTISEALKDIIRAESDLKFTDTDPDIEFSGSVVEFRVTSEAPQPGETTAFNRLHIAVSVDFTNNTSEDDAWTTRFPFFSDFASNQNLIDVQDQLVEEINKQLVNDIFIKAFNNW